MNQDFISSANAQELRFRCPHCQKLYCAQGDVFGGQQAIFDCQSCLKSFVLMSEISDLGLYKTQSVQDSQLKLCPKCTFLKPKSSDECPSCGVLESKYVEQQKAESPTLYELSQLWHTLINDFSNDEAHQAFINRCHQKMALNFAFKKYSELKNTLGFDRLCEHYMKQVEIRLEYQFKEKEAELYPSSIKALFSRTQILFLVIGLVGAASLIYNKIHPSFPNLTGLVVAMTLLSFGLVFISGGHNNIKIEE